MCNLRFAIISSDDRAKCPGQDYKSAVKQVSATDHKSQAPYFKHTFFFFFKELREGQAKDRNKMLFELGATAWNLPFHILLISFCLECYLSNISITG